MRIETPITLIESRMQGAVSATLIEGVSVDELKKTDKIWKPLAEQLDLPHSHWTWERKAQKRYPDIRFCGVDHPSGMQALMCTQHGEAQLSNGKKLIYVDYISSAPWNLRNKDSRQWILDDWDGSRFLGCGEVMMRCAITLSVKVGFGGGIGLHAIPDAELFYTRIGMTDMGIQKYSSREMFRYFEMTPNQANEYCREKS